MLRIKTSQFNEVCRLCSAFYSHMRCISTESIVAMIMDCAPVHVSVEDGLPQFICDDCFVLLNKITAFRKRCIESEKEFYKSIDEETNQTENDSIFRVPVKLEVSDTDTQFNDNHSDSETLINLIRNKECIESEKEFYKSIDEEKNQTDNDPIYLVQPELELIDPIKTEIPENDPLNTDNNFNDNNSDSETLLNIIKNKESDIAKYRCEFCSKVIVSFKEVEKHLEDEHKLKPKEYKIKFNYDPILENQECPLIPNVTDSSDLSNIRKPSLEKKKKNYAWTALWKKRIVECQVCHKKLANGSLQHHIATIHHNPKTYTCPHCPKTFTCERYVRVHNRRVHLKEPVIKKYLCDLCGYAGLSQSKLNIHRIKHSTERPYKCDQCSADFRSKGHLRSHINDKHLNLRPYVCSTCGHTFTKNRYLQDHIRTHTGERPFKCNFCEQVFGAKASLFNHKKKHR